jgi:hypothetical protein
MTYLSKKTSKLEKKLKVMLGGYLVSYKFFVILNNTFNYSIEFRAFKTMSKQNLRIA